MTERRDPASLVLAAAASGTAAVLVFALLPVINGALADRFDLSDAEIGFLSASYFFVYALVALSATLWIRRWSWRRASWVSFLLLVSGLSLIWLSTGFVAAVEDLHLAEGEARFFAGVLDGGPRHARIPSGAQEQGDDLLRLAVDLGGAVLSGTGIRFTS